MKRNVSIDQVQDYWDRRPCNLRHSPRSVGTRAYFDEVEARKYFVEPHIPDFADFPRWRDRRVLDAGCGIGTDTINFARHGAQVTAVDISPQSLAVARQRADVFDLSDRIQFYEADVERLSATVPIEPYDLLYSFGVLHHVLHPDHALDQLRRYTRPGTTLKIMLYHRYAWKVLWILMVYGKARLWQLPELVARYSEAQDGCPVTRIYRPKVARDLVQAHGFRVTDLCVDHIFPYRVQDYVRHRYVKTWYWRAVPRRVFRALERRLGWHICLTAVKE